MGESWLHPFYIFVASVQELTRLNKEIVYDG